VNYLVTKINDVKSFGIGSVKLQKSWNWFKVFNSKGIKFNGAVIEFLLKYFLPFFYIKAFSYI
jgi:hypothetical protein